MPQVGVMGWPVELEFGAGVRQLDQQQLLATPNTADVKAMFDLMT